MASDLSFVLEEKSLSMTDLSLCCWRLEGGILTKKVLPGLQDHESAEIRITRTSVSSEQIDQFAAMLHFLEVWTWRSDYDAAECGQGVSGGFAWRFLADLDHRACLAGGVNAYPSLDDPKRAALKQERYGVLLSALRTILCRDLSH